MVTVYSSPVIADGWSIQELAKELQRQSKTIEKLESRIAALEAERWQPDEMDRVAGTKGD